MLLRTIYIDVLITVNIFIDYILLVCTRRFLNIRASLKRVILGSLIGGVLSLTALLPKINPLINILLDVAEAMIIILIAFGFCSKKNYIKRVAVYFLFSFTFCGIMIGIYTTFKPSGLAIYNNTVYFNISPVLLIILTLCSYYIMIILKRLTKGVNGHETCNIEIITGGQSYTFCAKIDSGCNLKEPFSGDYVIIAEKSLFENLNIADHKTRIIPFESLGGEGIIKGFRPEMVQINGRKAGNKIYIGICENILKGEIKALIPSELANNQE